MCLVPIYCRVPPLHGLLFSVDWGHVKGLCKSGLSMMPMKLNNQQLLIFSHCTSIPDTQKIIAEGRPRQYVNHLSRDIAKRFYFHFSAGKMGFHFAKN